MKKLRFHYYIATRPCCPAISCQDVTQSYLLHIIMKLRWTYYNQMAWSKSTAYFIWLSTLHINWTLSSTGECGNQVWMPKVIMISGNQGGNFNSPVKGLIHTVHSSPLSSIRCLLQERKQMWKIDYLFCWQWFTFRLLLRTSLVGGLDGGRPLLAFTRVWVCVGIREGRWSFLAWIWWKKDKFRFI